MVTQQVMKGEGDTEELLVKLVPAILWTEWGRVLQGGWLCRSIGKLPQNVCADKAGLGVREGRFKS